MKILKHVAWIMVLALIISACTISASKKPKTTPTAGINPTATGSTISNVAAATATAQKVIATQQTGTKKTQKPTTAPVEATKSVQAAAFTATPLPPVGTTAPTRLDLASGGNLASARGEMNGGAVNSYVLKADAGQVLSVEVWSPNGDVYLSITTSDGKELLGSAAKATRWTGAASSKQDYTFNISATGGTTSFSIDIVVTAEGVTPSPKATGTSQTGTPKPTSGSAATGPFDPYAIYGSPSMKDPMNGGNVTSWVDSDGKLPNTSSIKMWLDNAKIYVTGKRAQWATWWFSAISLDDSYMQMTVETDVCAGKDSYGMILRGPGHGAGKSFGYIFAFSCDGSYQITRLDSVSPYSAVTLVGWTSSKHILDGSYQKNIIGMKLDGKTLTLYANGYELVEISDNVYQSGRYGVYIYPESSNDFTYRVVEMAYWRLGLKK
jgi:hypothetical protein